MIEIPQGFWKYLRYHPEDTNTFGVIADWCQDHDDEPQAEAWRYLSKHQKRPRLVTVRFKRASGKKYNTRWREWRGWQWHARKYFRLPALRRHQHPPEKEQTPDSYKNLQAHTIVWRGAVLDLQGVLQDLKYHYGKIDLPNNINNQAFHWAEVAWERIQYIYNHYAENNNKQNYKFTLHQPTN